MSHPFKLVFELKQHTPIIHFQGNFTSAGIRATELKPLLDKFLILKKGGWKMVPVEWKGAVVDENMEPLNYKVKIYFSGNTNHGQKVGTTYPGYFADMGDANKEEKYVSFSTNTTTLEIFCLHESLRQWIDGNIAEFFFMKNFGTRKSKGFGSFTVKGRLFTPPENAFSFVVNRQNSFRFKDAADINQIVFEAIDWFYKSLRGGINQYRKNNRTEEQEHYFYLKPMIFQYAHSKGITWEKKAIKGKFFDAQLTNQQKYWEESTEGKGSYPLWSVGKEYIVRDILGLTTEQSWKGYPPYGKKGAEITKTDTKTEIDRFQSSIFFKPVVNDDGNSFTVYFWNLPIPEEFRNAKFTIKTNTKGKKPFDLPIWSSFDFKEFFGFSFSKNRLQQSMNYDTKDIQASRLANLLSVIYNQLQKQIK